MSLKTWNCNWLFPGNVRSRRAGLTFSVVPFPFYSVVASGALRLWESVSLLSPSGFASLTLGVPLPDYTNYTIKVGFKAVVQPKLSGEQWSRVVQSDPQEKKRAVNKLQQEWRSFFSLTGPCCLDLFDKSYTFATTPSSVGLTPSLPRATVFSFIYSSGASCQLWSPGSSCWFGRPRNYRPGLFLIACLSIFTSKNSFERLPCLSS